MVIGVGKSPQPSFVWTGGIFPKGPSVRHISQPSGGARIKTLCLELSHLAGFPLEKTDKGRSFAEIW